MLLITTTGLAVSKHYCCGELVSTSLFTQAKSCCNSDSCCQNKTETFQLDEDFSLSSTLEIPESAQLDLFALAVILFDAQLEEKESNRELLVKDLPPPPKIRTVLSLRQTYLL